MKTISELQREIRVIREDLAKMDERLSSIDKDLLSFKDSLQSGTNFDHIYNLAEAMPIIAHPITSFQQAAKSTYMGIVLMTATLEDSITNQQLLFLQRMIMADPDRRRIDYYMGSLGKLQPDNVIFQLSDETITAHGSQLLLDMMIVARLGKLCTEKTFGVISDIASVLGKDKRIVIKITQAAIAVLTQSYEKIPSNSASVLYMDEHFGYYLGELPGWEKHVSEKRSQKAVQDAGAALAGTVGRGSEAEAIGKFIGQAVWAVGRAAGKAGKAAGKAAKKYADQKQNKKQAKQDAKHEAITQLVCVLSMVAEQKKREGI